MMHDYISIELITVEMKKEKKRSTSFRKPVINQFDSNLYNVYRKGSFLDCVPMKFWMWDLALGWGLIWPHNINKLADHIRIFHSQIFKFKV